MMDASRYFDSEKYFSRICSGNKLAAAEQFHFCTCSGVAALQGVLEQFRTKKAFFCLDDTNDGTLFQGRGGGWYKRRTFTVFILHSYDFKSMPSYRGALDVCRLLFLQVVSRLILDERDAGNELVYLHVDNILSRELGRSLANNCTGLYFMIDVDEPVDLRYNADQWILN